MGGGLQKYLSVYQLNIEQEQRKWSNNKGSDASLEISFNTCNTDGVKMWRSDVWDMNVQQWQVISFLTAAEVEVETTAVTFLVKGINIFFV